VNAEDDAEDDEGEALDDNFGTAAEGVSAFAGYDHDDIDIYDDENEADNTHVYDMEDGGDVHSFIAAVRSNIPGPERRLFSGEEEQEPERLADFDASRRIVRHMQR